jgi:hypothetical protein
VIMILITGTLRTDTSSCGQRGTAIHYPFSTTKVLLRLNIGASDLHFCFHSFNNEDIQDNNGDDSDDDEDREVCCSYLSVGSIIQGGVGPFPKTDSTCAHLPAIRKGGPTGDHPFARIIVTSLPKILYLPVTTRATYWYGEYDSRLAQTESTNGSTLILSSHRTFRARSAAFCPSLACYLTSCSPKVPGAVFALGNGSICLLLPTPPPLLLHNHTRPNNLTLLLIAGL